VLGEKVQRNSHLSALGEQLDADLRDGARASEQVGSLPEQRVAADCKG
jgi:hypothetical protein